jgi:hypothetical protein
MHETIKLNIEKMNEKHRIAASKCRKEVNLEPGDLVWLHLRKERFSELRKSKLMSHVVGPFKILAKINDNAYKLEFAYFMAVLVTWMSFASVTRELRRCALIIQETHIVMSSLIFRLVLTLMNRLASFIDLTITHMVWVHERIALCLDTLVTAHVLIMVIVSRVGPVFLLEGLTLTLSPDTWTVHIFSVMVHVPLCQMVKCKGL